MDIKVPYDSFPPNMGNKSLQPQIKWAESNIVEVRYDEKSIALNF